MYKINKNINKVIVFHHDDMDGQVSAKIAEHFIREGSENKDIEIKLYEVGYSKEVRIDVNEFNKNTLVVILDWSFHLTVFDDLVHMVGYENIIWIDHHKTAIDNYKQYPGIYLIDGIRYVGLCATELTYQFFKQSLRHIPEDYNIIPVPPYEAKNYSTEPVQNAIIEPLCLYLVGEWDMFRYSEEEQYVKHFSAGYLVKRPQMDDYSDEAKKFWELFYTQNTLYDAMYGEDEYMKYTNNIMEAGETINGYIHIINKRTIISYAFPAMIDKFPKLECVAVNTSSRSSLVFNNVRDKFHVGICYTFNGRFMCYSIYRLGKDPDILIDVSEIAKCYGGGGHPGAAGFNTEHRLVVTKIGELEDWLK